MTYRIKVENFEGPLDLLLFFIHRDKINIYDIPISIITDEFLSYLDVMQILNIRIAGEFILMASMLMHIKVKMLIPREKIEENAEDPRDDLVQRLLEYRQFKEVSEYLSQKFNNHSLKYPKSQIIKIDKHKEDPSEYLRNISLFDLINVFKNVLDRLPDENPIELNQEPINLDEQIKYVLNTIGKKKKITFTELITGLSTKMQIIVTFMAILELFRKNRLKLMQKMPFSEITMGIA